MKITRNNVDKTCAFLNLWAIWITAQSRPDMVYGAFQRTASANLPRPLLGIVLQDGAGIDRWQIGDQQHRYHDQHAVLLNCENGSQSGQPTRTGGLWICTFDLTQTLHTPLTKQLLCQYLFAPFAITQMTSLRQAFLDLIAVKQRHDTHPCPMHLKAAWLKLLANMHDELLAQPHHHTPAQLTTAHTSRPLPAAVARAIEYINLHYANPAITQEILARTACLDPHHFGRLFKSAVGQTPMRHLRQTRLRQAAFLLANTSKNITAITHEVGLSDPQHFARIFQNLYHQSPSQWRQQAR